MMAWSLDTTQQDDLRRQFMELDKNSSGTIKLCDFKETLKQTFLINGEAAEELFDQIDADSNEEIAYSDFLAAALTSRVDMHEDLLRTTFSRFDTNKTGYMTAEGLRQVLGGAASGVAEEDLEELLREVDTKGTGKVSFDQFIAWMKSGSEPPSKLQVPKPGAGQARFKKFGGQQKNRLLDTIVRDIRHRVRDGLPPIAGFEKKTASPWPESWRVSKRASDPGDAGNVGSSFVNGGSDSDSDSSGPMQATTFHFG